MPLRPVRHCLLLLALGVLSACAGEGTDSGAAARSAMATRDSKSEADPLVSSARAPAAVRQPAPPAQVRTELHDGIMLLRWADHSTDEVLYRVQWRSSLDKAWIDSPALPANSTRYATPPLETGSYQFRVIALNEAGAGFSDTLQRDVLADPPELQATAAHTYPGAHAGQPARLRAGESARPGTTWGTPRTVAVTRSTATLVWDDYTGGGKVLTYQVEWRRVGETQYWLQSARLPAGTNTYTITGLHPGDWSARIVAHTNHGAVQGDELQDAITAGRPAPAPTSLPAPADIAVERLAPDDLLLTWSPVAAPGLQGVVVWYERKDGTWQRGPLLPTRIHSTRLSGTSGHTGRYRISTLGGGGSVQSQAELTLTP